MKSGVVAVALGVAVAAVAVLVLTAAAVIGLGNLIGFGLSALAIGVVLGVVGAAILLPGISRIRRTNLKPEQTMETLEEDKAWLKQLR